MENVIVDVVIPIYNAYDYTKKCIETVIENTDLKKHQLILINDKSPDERIYPLIKKFKDDNKDLNIVVIDSTENNGFVKTVNIGMSYSRKTDVVLLNSDTEVTKNWLEKMIECAYSRPGVASVTPLSNNATLASVPNYLQDNILPDFIDLETYSKEIEECSFKYYPEIPTGHGFCMYIRRKAIEDVGLFDCVTFEKGYGEENDFSYRAIKKGYVHLLCDNTFIYHKGTQSFSKEKEEFILDHLKKLQEKHPDNYANTDRYVNNYPTAFIQENITYHIHNKYRKNVLFLVHDFRDFDEKAVLGGTTLHIYDLINNLKSKINFHVLYIENGYILVKSFFPDTEITVNLGKIFSYNKFGLYNNSYKYMLQKLFSLIKIDVIHIHHLLNQFLDIFDIAKEKNISVLTTIHDFYDICPTIQLLNQDNKYCFMEPNPNCDKCLKEKFDLSSGFIDNWRKEFYNKLKQVDKVITPSTNARELVNQVYKDINVYVIEHGIHKEDFDISNVNVKENKNMNIAFLGGINECKGLNILKEIKEQINSNPKSNINVHLFGLSSDIKLNKTDNKYIYHGTYDRKDISKLLKENNIQIVCLFSIWPETYSYTLTEAVMAEVPVITLDVGAISSRIKENGCGWALNINTTSNEILSKITDILNNKEEYNQKLKSVIDYKNKIIDTLEMCEKYEEIYSQYSSNYTPGFSKREIELLLIDNGLNKKMLGELYKANINLQNSLFERDLLRENYAKIEDQYIGVISSRRWKFFEKNIFKIIFHKKI